MAEVTEQDRDTARKVIERFVFDEQGFDPPETQNEKIAHASFISHVAQALADARVAERKRWKPSGPCEDINCMDDSPHNAH